MQSTQVRRVLEQKVQLAKDCKYFIKRKFDEETERDEEAEQRRKQMGNNGWSEYDGALYLFEENFLNTIGKNPGNATIEEYGPEALKYLEESFPFCFGINLRDKIETCSTTTFNLDLAFYAMCIGATEEQVGQIRSLLKSKKISTKCRDNDMDLLRIAPEQKTCCIDDIQSSTVNKYQGENLYKVLEAVNDKLIGSYMEYIMKSGGLNNPGKVFKGVCLYQDSQGNLYVAEGNHRVFAYQALKSIKEHIAGKSQKGVSFDATVYQVRLQELDVEL